LIKKKQKELSVVSGRGHSETNFIKTLKSGNQTGALFFSEFCAQIECQSIYGYLKTKKYIGVRPAAGYLTMSFWAQIERELLY
jgi:hypothetical protein